MVRWWFLVPLASAALLAACGRNDDGALQVAFIETPDNLFGGGLRLSPGARHLHAATEAGLVALNAQGEVIPALADRWIVTDDGRSFIFRLRDGTWPDGRDLTAESAREALRARLRALERTSLGLDLAPVAEVRAMAGRVVEIRLSTPVPSLLLLLAQPELALRRGDGGNGEMVLERQGDTALLAMKPPAARGIPEAADWREYVREIEVWSADAQSAVTLFDEGEIDVVLGGQIGALSLADTGPLSRGTVRLDPAVGLFGLQVRRSAGLLATDQGREALAMALDRPALIAPFNIAGWLPTNRIIPPGLPEETSPMPERWADLPIEDLRATAAARVAAWRLDHAGADARLTLAIGRSPGLDVLFRQLARQLATIGITLERTEPGQPADLALIDRVARYAEPRWFLNQLHCSLDNGLCVSAADALVREALAQTDAAARDALLQRAVAELTAANVFIPFGSPLRFSLVRSGVAGFAANAWAFHPLPALATIPR
jgi:ABC-type oligopeptide transport system substrate-binding subunit